MIQGGNDGDNRRKQNARLERLPAVKSLYLAGHPLYQIAKRLNLSKQQLEKDIKLLRKQWLKDAKLASSEVMAAECAKLDQIELEAWEAWERSKLPTRKTIKRYFQQYNKELDKVIDLTETRREVSQSLGDPRYLDLVLKAVQQRSKFLRLEDPDSEVAQQAITVEVVVESPDQVAKIINYQEFETIQAAAVQRLPEE